MSQDLTNVGTVSIDLPMKGNNHCAEEPNFNIHSEQNHVCLAQIAFYIHIYGIH